MCQVLSSGPKAHALRALQVQAEGDRQTALGDGEALAQYKAELHGSCDFLLKPAGTPAGPTDARPPKWKPWVRIRIILW